MGQTRREPALTTPAPSKIDPEQVTRNSTTRTRVMVLEDLSNAIADDARRAIYNLVADGWAIEDAIEIVRDGWYAVVDRGIEMVTR